MTSYPCAARQSTACCSRSYIFRSLLVTPCSLCRSKRSSRASAIERAYRSILRGISRSEIISGAGHTTSQEGHIGCQGGTAFALLTYMPLVSYFLQHLTQGSQRAGRWRKQMVGCQDFGTVTSISVHAF